MTPKLVIFDCDGVIVDTEPVTDIIIADSLTAHGLPFTPQQVHAELAGQTLDKVAQEATRRGAMLPSGWVDTTHAAFYDAFAAGAEIVPGFVDLIDRLQAAGVATAIASNAPRRKMQITLGPSGLFDRFDGRIYSGEEMPPKPLPDMLLAAMQAAGATAAETVFVDDMPAGWTAAQAAGCRCYAHVAKGGADRAAGYEVIPVTGIEAITADLGL